MPNTNIATLRKFESHNNVHTVSLTPLSRPSRPLKWGISEKCIILRMPAKKSGSE